VLTSGVVTTIDVPGAAATFGRGINQRGDVTGNFRPLHIKEFTTIRTRAKARDYMPDSNL